MIALGVVPPAGVISSPKAPVGTVRKIGPHGALPIEIPGAALGVPLPSLTGETGGRAVEAFRRDRLFYSLGRELGGETAQNFAQWLPCVGSLHGSNHEGNRAHEVVKACRRLGNVCRA